MTRCEDATLLLGSYLLGGLEPDETAELEQHLATCARCREALERMAPLPRLLDSLEPTEAADLVPPQRLEGAVLAGFTPQRPQGGSKRSRRRWPLAAAGALAGTLATVAVLAIAGVFSSGRAHELRVTLVSPGGGTSAIAQARLVSTSVGTEVDLDARLPKLRAGEVYELWFAGEHGLVSAGTFAVDARGWARARLTTAARPGPYARLGITREPDGLDPARNGPNVVAGPLPG